MDPQLVEKIVHEVKSQGVFDEFRKDSMSDVDTKPAYQNLRQRVEHAIKSFLSAQRWSPDMNKNQLRERLRKHITESGFLDVGVERIVDQVVNPKIGSVFQPRIEEIAYKYLGIPLPPPVKYEPAAILPLPPLPPINGDALKVETFSGLMPNDLEQISPDSDKATVKSESKSDHGDVDMDLEDKALEDDDDDSPPFEPLVKNEHKQHLKENLINNSSNSDMDVASDSPLAPPGVDLDENSCSLNGEMEAKNIDTETRDSSIVSAHTPEKELISQDSQLSQVSSNSRLSTSFHDESLANDTNTQSKALKEEAVNISEEAQMPKFSENSSETNTISNQQPSQLHFDIKKDEIKFEGTERKTNLDTSSPKQNCLEADEQITQVNKESPSQSLNETENNFQFNAVETGADTPLNNSTPHDSSFGSSLEDSAQLKLCIVEKSKSDSLTITESQDSSVMAIAEAVPRDLHDSLPTPPPSQTTVTTKEDTEKLSNSTSSSSSRHKKHSKHSSRRSHDRDYKKTNSSDDRKRDKDRHSSSTYKHSSSSHRKSDSKPDKTSSGSLKHSNSSSSSISQRSESKHRDSKYHSSKERSKSTHSTSSPSKRSSSSSHHKASHDDHYQNKVKPSNRRKSNNSSDDDHQNSGLGTGSNWLNGTTQQKSANSSTNGNGKSKSSKKSSENNSKANNDCSEASTQQLRNKVIILNDILQNPNTNFIELETRIQTNNPLQVVSSTPSQPSSLSNCKEIPEESSCNLDDLLYFDESIRENSFANRLRLFDDILESCRSAVNSLRFGYELQEAEEANQKFTFEQRSRKRQLSIESGSGSGSSSNQGALIIDCLEDSNERMQHRHKTPPRKRMRSTEEGKNKPSPTPSDLSVNSKENEIINSSVDSSKQQIVKRRHSAQNKLSLQQRYTSEDLYKPRPILSQRSRRRVLD